MGSYTALRTLRAQSGTCGYRTLGSILASSYGGAASFRRVYKWYVNQGNTTEQVYTNTLNLKFGNLREKYNHNLINNYNLKKTLQGIIGPNPQPL
jgi:hypothetical protein